MANLSKDKVKQIVENRPEGVSPEKVIAGLKKKGYQIEGLAQPKTTSADTPEPTTETKSSTAATLEEPIVTLGEVSNALDVVFGGQEIGQAIGTQMAEAGLTGLSEEEQQYVSEGPSAMQLGGDVLQAGITAGSAGIGGLAARGTGKLAMGLSKLPGVSRIARGAAGTISGVTTGAVTGAAEATARGLEQEDLSPEMIQSGATTGAILGGAFDIAPKALTGSAKKIFSKVYKMKPTQERKALKGIQKLPTVVQMRKLRPGTMNSLYNQADEQIKKQGDEINQILKGSREVVQTGDVLDDALRRTSADYAGNVDEKAIRKIIDDPKLPVAKLQTNQPLSLKEANEARSIIDRKFLGSQKWLTENDTEPMKVDFLKNLAHSLRERVKAADTRLPQKFNDQQGMLALKTLLENPNKSQSWMEKFGLYALGYGALSGVTGGDLPWAVQATGFGAGLYGLGKASKSAITKMSAAKSFDLMGRTINKMPETFTRQQLINVLVDELSK